jgi:hypothetical protein
VATKRFEDELMGIGPSIIFRDKSRSSMCGSEERNDGRFLLIRLKLRSSSCRLLRFLNPAQENGSVNLKARK